ncbi:MAG: glycosyltransferase family 2 protein [Candidatus Acidiferrales bacterium]
MKISVLIPAYNCAATIQATLNSVLRQSLPAEEILVMDDGSTDQTAAILKLYEPRIRVFWQPNGGVSRARNALIARARGDLIAFLDSDDVWHPGYLELQRELFLRCPGASAAFAAHANFCGVDSYRWDHSDSDGQIRLEIFEPVSFFRRFQIAPGHFVFSFCCVPKRVLESIGSLPFDLKVAEDVYFCNLLPFLGPVVFATAPLFGAYRVRAGSLASNRLECAEGEVNAFELLEKHYTNRTGQLVKEFKRAFASKRRAYAKILLGVGRTSEARGQLWRSIMCSGGAISLAKSFALVSLSGLPRSLQPKWPPVDRQRIRFDQGCTDAKDSGFPRKD